MDDARRGFPASVSNMKPPGDDSDAKEAIAALLSVMRSLRDPATGCAWDLRQTFSTIAPYTIEETYEVVDAIVRGDMADLRDELGDLLLQVVYHAQMASETGAFSFRDVARSVTEKMVRRHPHVFGDVKVSSVEEQSRLWEEIKAKEAAEANQGGHAAAALLDKVPAGFSPLLQAVKLQNAAGAVGFDWREPGPIFEKIREELAELEDACASQRKDEIVEEMGDLLFVVANLARRLDVDPETALMAANVKFRRRFGQIESKLAAVGKSPAQSTLAEMDSLWEQAKLDERKE